MTLLTMIKAESREVAIDNRGRDQTGHMNPDYDQVDRNIPTYLEKYFHYRLDALTPCCVAVLCQYLNGEESSLLSDLGFPKNWRGLAERFRYDSQCIDGFQQHSNPTEALLNDWKLGRGATVQALLECIHDIGRFDLLEGERLRAAMGSYVQIMYT